MQNGNSKPLNFIIVGAGVSGLASAIGLRQAGHNVTILEQSQRLVEVGAGIQIPPNAARVLDYLNVFEEVRKKAVTLSKISVRRWANWEELTGIPVMPELVERYQWPMSFIYRGDLQRIFLERVAKLGVEIRLGQKVVQVDDHFAPRVQVASGEWISGDVVIAADGIKSRMRSLMVAKTGLVDRTIPTGDAAYRLLIPRERVLQDLEALKVLDGEQIWRVIGPGGHIIMYPISPKYNEETGKRENQLLNMGILHPQTSLTPDEESWTTRGSKSEMIRFCRGWAPIVQTLISFVPDGEVLDWTLNIHLPLATWTAGSITLIGDACHPMLPYLAQGAAQCLEDVSVLVECFRRTSDVRLALSLYELARKTRAETIQQSGTETRDTIHLPDGPEQEARDAKFRAAAAGAKPDKFVDASFQDFMYGVDPVKELDDHWDELVKRVQESTSKIDDNVVQR